MFLVSNFLLTMFATALTVYVAPAAAGSGIPEVKAYLNGVDAPNIFCLKTLLVKVHHFISPSLVVFPETELGSNPFSSFVVIKY